MFLFDIETDGLLEHLTTIHCIGVVDVYSGEETLYGPGQIETALKVLAEAPALGGHNIIGFDIPAIQKLYPTWRPPARLMDTLVACSVVFADIYNEDVKHAHEGTVSLPKRLYGRQSLEAWGHRLGNYKDDYKEKCEEAGLDPWAAYSDLMGQYCLQDVRVTESLWRRIQNRLPDGECLDLEMRVAAIIERQVRRGFAFDVPKALALQKELLEKHDALHARIVEEVGVLCKPGAVFTPKRANKAKGYLGGSSFTKVTFDDFNPSSDQQLARYLLQKGWKPKEFTPTGQPIVSETVLADVDLPLVPEIRELKILQKRLGQLCDGSQAWLMKVKNGRIHGRVRQNGAVTGRMTHESPNLAQVPSNTAPYGKQCRDLFIAGPGYTLLGCDAEGLELRCLAHYMARFDEGAYGETVVHGRKEDESDVHNVNRRAVGLRTRPAAKTFIYAYLYGAGDLKLGSIVWEDMDPADRPKNNSTTLRKLGANARKNIQTKLPALGQLTEAVKKASKRGWLKGLDGRRIPVRSEHAALNSLLQSAGAVLMKKALVLLDERLRASGLKPGRDYEFVANVHDEFQMEVLPALAAEISVQAKQSIVRAGEHFKFRCALAGSVDTGRSWAETH